MTKLKPCPFCGGKAKWDKDWQSIYCTKCRARIYAHRTYSDAVESWNNRPSPWHTGTPTEEGWYLLKIQSDDEIIYDTDKLIQCLWGLDWKYAHQEILEWQKIEEKEDGNNNTR